MSEEKESSASSSVRSVLGKRGNREYGAEKPAQKRIKLAKKEDSALVKQRLEAKQYKIINYSEDDSKTFYRFVYCVIDTSNSVQFAKHIDSADFDKTSFKNIILSIGSTPYAFGCIKCYEKNIVHLWKYNTSSRNFFNHQRKDHELICEKYEWKKEHRMQMLQPTISYVSWDRNSFNAKKGDGLLELLGAAFNLGTQIKVPLKSLGMSFVGILYIRIYININKI